VDERAAFLRAHPPFDTLDAEALEAVAAVAEPRRFAAGATILGRATPAPAFAYVVRSGSVELVVDGHVHDLLGEGEMFGYAAMLAELPVGYTARAGQEAVLYRIPEPALRPVLERPAALRYVARALAERPGLIAQRHGGEALQPAGRPVRDLLRAPPIVCEPSTGVQEAARRMEEARATCVLVDLGATVGIVTDHDLRTRVVAAGAGPRTPLSSVMTTPARTLAADRPGSEALLAMLDHGVRHLPVTDARGRVLGVVDDIDLMAGEQRAPFHLRARVAAASDPGAVADAAAGLPRTVIALHDARVAAPTISGVIASIRDTVTRRLLDLAVDDLGTPPAPLVWLALGSHARRELYPGSDADTAMAWDGPDAPDVRGALHELAERVMAGLSASGIRPCPEGVVATSPVFARPLAGWEEAARAWQEDPDRDRGLTLLSVAIESAPVWGADGVAAGLSRVLADTRRHEHTVRRLAVAALARRPPTGFLRQFVLEHSGERKGLLDLKGGGVGPIVALARWGAMVAGVTAASTTVRLEAAEAAGTLEARDAAVLREAFELLGALRMEHQVERLRSGLAPDDLIDPTRLTDLTRRSLKDVFRAVAAVQRGVAVRLGLTPR
jgi:CBS domain-containing protein